MLADVVCDAAGEGRTVVMVSHELEVAASARDPRGPASTGGLVVDAPAGVERTGMIWREAALVAGKDLRIEARPAWRSDRSCRSA